MSTAAKLAVIPASAQSDQGNGEIMGVDDLAKRLKVKKSWVYKHTGKDCRNRLPVLPGCAPYLRFYWPDVFAWLRGKG